LPSPRCALLYLASYLIFLLLASPSASLHYTLSLHDALPICVETLIENPDDCRLRNLRCTAVRSGVFDDHILAHLQNSRLDIAFRDRKSTRLNSSHVSISYAVFCLKKKTVTPTWTDRSSLAIF